jgi:hypothetical protein
VFGINLFSGFSLGMHRYEVNLSHVPVISYFSI